MFKLEREKLKCVNQDDSLGITSHHAQRDTSLKAREENMVYCRLSGPVKFAESMVERRSFDPDSTLVARFLNLVSKRRYIVV